MTEPNKLITGKIARNAAAATLCEVDGRWVLTMTRILRHPAERVWPMLTEVDQLRRWSPVVPDRPLESTGPALCKETAEAVDAEVLVHDAPHELVHRWGDNLLRWTLTTVPGGTRLILEQTFDQRGMATMSAAGWHICLAVLTTLADGHDVERVVGRRANDYGWPAMRDRYDATLASTPALQLEWRFPGAGDTTLVRITETGFSGDGDQQAAQAIDAFPPDAFPPGGVEA